MPPNCSASVTTPSFSGNPEANALGERRRSAAARAGKPDDLRRAAADIEQQNRFGRRIRERSAAVGGEMRLGFAIDDFEFEARAFRRRARRIRAPFSAARQASVAISRARVTSRASILARQICERLDRALDRRFAEPPGLRNSFAEPHDAGKGIDDPESGRVAAMIDRPRDQKPAIVGAEIERSISRRAPFLAVESGGRRMQARVAGGTRDPVDHFRIARAQHFSRGTYFGALHVRLALRPHPRNMCGTASY